VSGTRWQRIDELFHRALAAPEVARDTLIAEAAGDDAALAAEVHRLLRAHRAAGTDFLDTPAGMPASFPDDDPSLAGRTVGAYRLIREIGRGGMGSVYLAERADRQFEKRLAIKLVKRGMDSDSILRRFRAERQILATLDHPNIARLLDGGTTDDGHPYFVMELVEGDPIDEYAAARRLPVEARLELFRQVCAAVSYAHQHLVIHRDLKPSNILVTADGTVKLLDFGIARILGSGEPEAPSTVTVLGLMTPEFASPEQVRGRPTTTQSDVYALGVVLYRLLTGAAPYRLDSHSPDELARVIGGVEPARPSTAGAGTRRLRGDLDNIVLKALRKEPERRYASVEQFAEDIRRHLAGLPVIARPDTVGYRAAKFVQRNRVAVVGAVVVFLTLVGGILATSWQAQRARAAQARAERRFEEVRKLARTVIFDYHDAIKDLPGATPVRERIVKDALSYLDGLSREAGRDTALLTELGNAYERVGDVQGGTLFANLGNTAGAASSYRKALELYEARRAITPHDLVARRDVAVTHAMIGQLTWEMGQTDSALAAYRTAIEQLEPLVAEFPRSDEIRSSLAACQDYQGLILQDRGDIDGAIAAFQGSIRSYRAHSDSTSEQARRGLAPEYEHLASALIDAGRIEEAHAAIRQAIALWNGLIADFPDNAGHRRAVGVGYFFEGDILDRLGRQEESLASYRRFLDASEHLARLDPENELYRGDQSYALNRMGDRLVDLGRIPEAIQAYDRSRGIREADVAADPVNLWKRAALIECHAKLSRSYALAGQAGPAVRQGGLAFDLMSGTEVEASNAMMRGHFAETYAQLGDAFAQLAADGRTPPGDRTTRWREARDMYRRSADIWRDLDSLGVVTPDDAKKPIQVAESLARCEAALGGTPAP
jgi:tetratricopeptide (TPR) repeat protein/tRNA A-37 threonylcarbamoyl transferase component Bud32